MVASSEIIIKDIITGIIIVVWYYIGIVDEALIKAYP